MTKTIKLNLGSGPSGINGWINYDSGILPWLSKHSTVRKIICALKLLPGRYDVNWPETQLVDIRGKFPLEDNSVDYIYCSQVLEHFEKYETEKILAESYRVLKSGGLIRLSLPDIDQIFKIYTRDRGIDPLLASRNINIIWWGYEKNLPPHNLIAKISRFFIRDHQWHYNKPTLKQMLKVSGFKDIRFYSFRNGNVPDIRKLDLEIHKDHSLYVEARK